MSPFDFASLVFLLPPCEALIHLRCGGDRGVDIYPLRRNLRHFITARKRNTVIPTYFDITVGTPNREDLLQHTVIEIVELVSRSVPNQSIIAENNACNSQDQLSFNAM